MGREKPDLVQVTVPNRGHAPLLDEPESLAALVAMVDAGRCWLAAGEPERALAFFDQVETEAPDLQLPDYMKVVVRELREASPAGAKPIANAGAARPQPALGADAEPGLPGARRGRDQHDAVLAHQHSPEHDDKK